MRSKYYLVCGLERKKDVSEVCEVEFKVLGKYFIIINNDDICS